jgi:DEAD/DEAH box helicase domain-containing protein
VALLTGPSTGELAARVSGPERTVVHTHVLPARDAEPGRTAVPLLDGVSTRLAARGVTELWSHQAAAIDLLRAGRHVVVATSTASGKSLCYQVPIVEAALSGTRETALLLTPTKALAHDQLASLQSWLVPDLVAAAYDGDTTPDERAWARRSASVIVTNPDMLHAGILPYHARWATFLMRLRYVVVDELHVLRGVFGSHVALLLRRLRRLCERYGSTPTFCFTSATIGEPGTLAANLSGLDVVVVDDDGSPRPERRLELVERPVIDLVSGARRSAHEETARVLAELVADGAQVLAFTRSRRAAELVALRARLHLETLAPARASSVAAYRGGFLAEERRALEQALASGELRGVATTSALELGIDLSGLDAVVIDGFPGTVASMWQQAGRAGRRADGRVARAVVVAGDDQLDAWFCRHPEQLLSRPPEPAVVNPDNPYVVRPQMACAAYEQPLAPDDASWFGDGVDDAACDLVRADLLRPRQGQLFWAIREPPFPSVSLRSSSVGEVELRDTDDRLVGTIDEARLWQAAHPGALYLHQGRQYRVRDVDARAGLVRLELDDAPEFTQTRSDTQVDLGAPERVARVGGIAVHLGPVEVRSRVVSYQRRAAGSGEVLEVVELDVPEQRLETRACWYTVAPSFLPPAERWATWRSGRRPVDERAATRVRLLGAVHAAEHALIGMLPLFAICDRWDVGGVSTADHPATGAPTIVVYDGYLGGAGIADLAFAVAAEHLVAARDLVDACGCEAGCPSCVQSPKCGNGNESLDKAAAVALLEQADEPF